MPLPEPALTAMTMTKSRGAPGNVLVIYRKQLGDLLLLQPALQLLSERFDAPIRVCTRAGFADLLQLMPGDIALASNSSRDIRQVYCFDSKASTLRDALYCWPNKRTLILTRPERVWWHKFFFHEILTAGNRDDYRARMFQQTLGGTEFSPPTLNAPPLDWLPDGIPQNYIVVHPTSAWRRKTWPAENWIAVLNELHSQIPWPLVITAGNESWEREMADAIASNINGGALNLAGQTSLRNYLAVLAGANAVLCVDGSASHIAAAFGRPTLTLFGPTKQAHWHYATARSKGLSAADFTVERKPPVAAIPVAAVFAAARQLLDSSLND